MAVENCVCVRWKKRGKLGGGGGGGGVSASQTSLHGARLVGVCKSDRTWGQGWWVSASLTEPGGGWWVSASQTEPGSKAGGCLQA